MKYTGLFLGVIIAVTAGSAACGRGDDQRQAQQAAAATRGAIGGKDITVTGCLSGAADRGAFVVTADRNALTSVALDAGSGDVPTYTYELVGTAADLATHVGKQVEVTGRVDDDRRDDVTVDNKDKTEGARVQSGDDKVTPVVETKEEMEIKVRRLQVVSIKPTGGNCTTAQ